MPHARVADARLYHRRLQEQQFDGDIRSCLKIAGVINLFDPAATCGPDDLVWADPVSCHESHRHAIVRPLPTTLG